MKRNLGKSAIILSVIALGASCSSDPGQLDNDELSALLSLANVRKTEVRSTASPDLISGLIIDTTVIHTGFDRVNVPFRMTWAIRRNGSVLGTATRDFAAGFRPGQSEPVRLVLNFAPTPTLIGTSDVVTFDLLDTTSLSPIGS